MNERFLSDEEVAELVNNVFLWFSLNKESRITPLQLKSYLKDNNHFLNNSNSIDTIEFIFNSNKMIGVKELTDFFKSQIKKIRNDNRYTVKTVIRRNLTEMEAEKKVNQIFYTYDKNFNGSLDIEELRVYFLKKGLFKEKHLPKIITKINSKVERNVPHEDLKRFFMSHFMKKEVK